MANKNLFQIVKMANPPRSRFDLTHDVKTTLNFGELVPILVMDCVPGDKVNLTCEALLRFAPLVAPVMHRFSMTMHYFFVPNRLVWPGWEKWIFQDELAGEFPTITVNSNGSNYTRLMNRMFVPNPANNPGASGSEVISAIPFAALQMIYNEYYRDQNLITEVPFELVDGDNTANTNLTAMRKRAWEHDYFTASLPWAQKGDPVDIPIGSQNVVLNPDSEGVVTPREVYFSNYNVGIPDGDVTTRASGFTQVVDGFGASDATYDPNGTLMTEDNGEATTINDLRRAFRLQEFLERNARGVEVARWS